MALKLRCSWHECNAIIDFTKKLFQLGSRCFCSAECQQKWQQQENIFQYAAKGGPTLGRRPSREKKWHQRDDYSGDG